MLRSTAFLIPLLLVCGQRPGAAKDYYVSPVGRDDGPGSAAEPFASLNRAVEASRQQPGDAARRVLVGPGRYWNVRVNLDERDSGLTIEAAAAERPELLGGRRLAGWIRDGDRFYAAPLPESNPPAGADSDSGVRLLLVNGEPRPRARFPESGELAHVTTFDVPWMSSTEGGWKRKPTHEELTTLRYQPGLLPSTLEVRNAEITVLHMWDESCVGVAAHDAANGVLMLRSEAGHPPGAFGVKKFVVWNTREGMTKPGQWYDDRKNHRIVYWPLPGEDMSRAEAVIPTVTSIITVGGERDRTARDITLRGLRLAATTVPLITGGFAAAAFPGAIELRNARHCTMDSITISGVAGHGIKGRQRLETVQVINSEIEKCGAGGIYVGGTGAVISNNLVRAVGRNYPSAIGIAGRGDRCLVSHNEVHDCTYSAISYGGSGNVLEANELYDCMKVLHDGAAIYVSGGTNCVLRGNMARDFKDTGGYGASAYYLDERCYGCVVEKNLSMRVNWPSHNHMATNNCIRDNVFLIDGDAKLTFARSTGYTFASNLLYATGKIRIEGVNAVTNWSGNLFYAGAGRVERVQLQDYSSTGTELGPPADTLMADPLLWDWERGDLRFKPGSPALKLGMQVPDAATIGRLPKPSSLSKR